MLDQASDKLATKGSDVEIDKLCSAQWETLLVYRMQAGKGLDGVLEVRRGGEEMVPSQRFRIEELGCSQ